MIEVIEGDCRDVLARMPADSIECCITDPPYGLSKQPDIAEVLRHWLAGDDYKHDSAGFMGRDWDSFVPGPATWREVFRVLKPGAHLLCFAGTRTQDLMGISLRLAGFEIRDCVMFLYGTGFPKSLDVSKQLDKMAGAERAILSERTLNNNRFATSGSGQDQERFRKFEGNANITAPATPEAAQWAGWGTALKPSHEPIICARKPLSERTVAAQVLATGTGALNIDVCRVATDESLNGGAYAKNGTVRADGWGMQRAQAGEYQQPTGRWPANVITDGSPEVLEAFAAFGESKSARSSGVTHSSSWKNCSTAGIHHVGHGDSGSPARFFYSSKASRADRAGSKHPTVKPVSLCEYLVRLVCPPNGTVLDPFAGSGTMATAAHRCGVNATLIEREPEYVADIKRRIAALDGKPEPAANTVATTLTGQPTLFESLVS